MNNKETAQRKQKSLWPSWFPYPMPWLRSLCVLLWADAVLRIAGFWGIVLGRTASVNLSMDVTTHTRLQNRA